MHGCVQPGMAQLPGRVVEDAISSPHNIYGPLAHEPEARNEKEVRQKMFEAALLVCCSFPLIIRLPLLMRGENLTRRKPRDESENVGSQAKMENRLPYYTAWFE